MPAGGYLVVDVFIVGMIWERYLAPLFLISATPYFSYSVERCTFFSLLVFSRNKVKKMLAADRLRQYSGYAVYPLMWAGC